MTASFWEDRRVVVTGGFGFLGSHLVGALVDRGAAVVVLRRDAVPASSVVAGWEARVSVVSGDVRDQPTIERMLREHETQTVFHLAAQALVGVANRDPVPTFESNVRGTWSVLEATRLAPGIEQVLVASSDKAYGTQPSLPYTEDMPLLARNPYDVSKACADALASSYAATFGLPACVARCGNLFGPGDLNFDRLVPGTIRDVLAGNRPVIRSDGSPTRDYIHVTDGAHAYLTLAEAMAERSGVVGEAFNFSTEEPLSVLDVVHAVRAAAGRPDLEPDVRNDAEHEIEHQYLSAEKARQVLDWKPRLTFAEGLAPTVAWYRDHLRGS